MPFHFHTKKWVKFTQFTHLGIVGSDRLKIVSTVGVCEKYEDDAHNKTQIKNVKKHHLKIEDHVVLSL